jgi:hypothetical protein
MALWRTDAPRGFLFAHLEFLTVAGKYFPGKMGASPARFETTSLNNQGRESISFAVKQIVDLLLTD